MRRAKIVCTIGPASESPAVVRQLIEAGMDVARLNLAHASQAWHGALQQRLRLVSEELGRPVGILWDLGGPKLRIGRLQEGGLLLQPGQEIVLTTRPIVGQGTEVPVQYPHLPEHVRPGERILLNDGLLEVQVLEAAGTEIRARVVVGGLLESNKGLNLPKASLAIPAITAKDRDDLRLGLELGVDWVALSFVRTADEVRELKELMREHVPGRPAVPVISKIEKPEAIDNIDSLIAESDGIMVARGDLGIETSPEQVPIMQKMIIARCNAAGKPVITATQMLESMIHNPRPTRAEASDVANAVLDGTDALMLSGETAAGEYPLQAVRTMANIVQYAERERPATWRRQRLAAPECGIAEAVSHASTETAADVRAAAIITPTASGYTARMVARYRPEAPIIAVTPSPVTQRQLTVYWGVCPLLARRTENTDQMTADAVQAAVGQGWVQPGETVVVTGGTAGSPPGTTNMITVRVVGPPSGNGRSVQC